MTTIVRTARWALPVALVLPIAACSGASGEEETAQTTASALDPSNVIPATNYDVSMWIQVNNVLDTTAAPASNPPSLAGTCYPANEGACDNCNAWPCWTTDTGYQLWAELAAKVTPTNGLAGTSVPLACALTTPAGLGANTWDPFFTETNPNAATITTCSGAGYQNGGANGGYPGGSPLSISVQINDPSQTVSLGVVVDNIEATPAASVPASTVGTTLGLAGDGLSALGYVVKLIADGTPVGAVYGAIGSALSVAGLLAPPGTSTPGQEETCVGGMFPKGDGTASDTLVVSLTGAQLEAAALSSGDLTYHSSGSWAPTSNGADHCSADMTIHLHVTRDWSSGLAAAPRSGDFAIVSTPSQMNVFVVPQTAAAGPATLPQFVGVHGDDTTWSAPANTQIYNEFWNEGGVTSGTTGAIVQTVVASASGNDEYFFWADDGGSLHVAPFSHTSSAPLFYNNTIFDKTYETLKLCFIGGRLRTCGSIAHNYLPNNAQIAAISRGPTNLDAFFIDALGNLWNVYSADSGNTWGSYQVTSDGAGVAGSPVSAVARTAATVDVFFLGQNGLAHASTAANGAPWVYETVANTGGLATAGAHLAATAQTVHDIDVFFVDTKGNLWRTYEASPGQPTLVAVPVSPIPQTAVPDGYPGGPIAAVSRQPGVLDVVFRPWAEVSPTWYSMNAATGGQWVKSMVPAGDVTNGISIVAPSSFELRVFTNNYLNDVYTTDWISTGRPTWTPLYGVETLTAD